MAKTVVAFGEVLWDLLPSGAVLGGAPFNFAYRVSSLGDRGIMMSRLGRDEPGDRALGIMSSLGLDTSCIQRDPSKPTGAVPVTLDSDNNPDFTILPDVAYDFIELSGTLIDILAKADLFCYGTLAQRSPVSRHTLSRLLDMAGCPAFCDINLRRDCHSPGVIDDSLRRAGTVKLNDAELREISTLFRLGGDDIPSMTDAVMARWDVGVCIVTLGEAGAYAATWDGDRVHVPGCRVTVADTVGSGDAFSAACAHALLHGASLAEACSLGVALGSLTATLPGGTSPVSPSDIESFMASKPERITHPELATYTR